jgi:hypothetical protein
MFEGLTFFVLFRVFREFRGRIVVLVYSGFLLTPPLEWHLI